MSNTPAMTYHVAAQIQDESRALIQTRGHKLILNAAETLLAARVPAC